MSSLRNFKPFNKGLEQYLFKNLEYNLNGEITSNAHEQFSEDTRCTLPRCLLLMMKTLLSLIHHGGGFLSRISTKSSYFHLCSCSRPDRTQKYHPIAGNTSMNLVLRR